MIYFRFNIFSTHPWQKHFTESFNTSTPLKDLGLFDFQITLATSLLPGIIKQIIVSCLAFSVLLHCEIPSSQNHA